MTKEQVGENYMSVKNFTNNSEPKLPKGASTQGGMVWEMLISSKKEPTF